MSLGPSWLVQLGFVLGVSISLSCGCTTARETAPSGEGGPRREAQPCSGDTDCPPEMRCAAESDAAEEVASRRLLVPMPLMPCPYADCTSCEAPLLCQPSSQVLGADPTFTTCGHDVCASPCTMDSDCPAPRVCRETGLCEELRCDEEGGPSCLDHETCDPTASATTDGCRRFRCDEAEGDPCPDGSVCEPNDGESDILGCRRLLCDEPGALACNELVSSSGEGTWECDPTQEGLEEVDGIGEGVLGWGCVPVPCTEGGTCHGDRYICEPTSSAPRMVGGDLYGCVYRNCEEGLDCSFLVSLPDDTGQATEEVDIGYCDHDGPYATVDGCARRHCSEFARGCPSGELCDPEHPAADPRGCRGLACDDVGGPECGDWVCDPLHPRSSLTGCRALQCEDMPDTPCPEGTECNSRGANADNFGCAPPGDAESSPVPPGPATTDAPQTSPVATDGASLPVVPGPGAPGPLPEGTSGTNAGGGRTSAAEPTAVDPTTTNDDETAEDDDAVDTTTDDSENPSAGICVPRD